jgi:hypothetical protein
MFNELITFLDSQEPKWKYSQIENKTIVVFGIEGKNGRFHCVADVKEKDFQFLFYTIASVKVPADKMQPVAELLTRLNSNKILGNFELSYDNRQIRYKTSADFEGNMLTQTQIEKMIMINIVAMDICIPEISLVVYGELSPEEALDKILKKETEN